MNEFVKIIVIVSLFSAILGCSIKIGIDESEKPGTYEYFFVKAKKFSETGQWIKASQNMKEAIKIKKSPEGYFLLGFFYSKAYIMAENKYFKSLYEKSARKYLARADRAGYEKAKDVLVEFNIISGYKSKKK